MEHRNRTILYVDDDPDDQFMLSESLREVDPNVDVIVAGNGLQALNYLNSLKIEAAFPCLIILDLNMPVLNGRKTLESVKSNQTTNFIPVVVFTSSRSPEDEKFCSQFGVEMITKPSSFRELSVMSGKFLSYCQ